MRAWIRNLVKVKDTPEALACGLAVGFVGFAAEEVDAEFFPDGKWKSIFLLNLGHGDPAKLHPRAPRLDFDEDCRIV